MDQFKIVPLRSADKEARWKVTLTYRMNEGVSVREFYLEEVDDLSSIIERGPDWNTLEDCRLQLNRRVHPTLTVEQSFASPGPDFSQQNGEWHE